MNRSFGLGVATAVLVMLGINAYGQAPAASPAPNPTGPAEQGGELQQITVTGYIIPRVSQSSVSIETTSRRPVARR
jgi:hypothetical protein